MIVKERDAKKSNIADIEHYETPGMDSVQRLGLKQAAARLRADCTTGNACRHIDGYFADSDDWVVIHDLRLRHEKHVMQINHLLINSSFEFYIVDTRYLKNALTLNEHGQCWALTSKHSMPIASPLNKLNRDIRLLRDIIKQAKDLPTFLGISPTINVQGYVLTNPTLKTTKPSSSTIDASPIIASDMLFASVWNKPQGWMRSKVKNIDSKTLVKFAQTLLSLHVPTVSTGLMGANESQHSHRLNQEQDTSHCAQCSKPVTANIREESFRHMDIFQGQVLCLKCQTAAQNQYHLSVGM